MRLSRCVLWFALPRIEPRWRRILFPKRLSTNSQSNLEAFSASRTLVKTSFRLGSPWRAHRKCFAENIPIQLAVNLEKFPHQNLSTLCRRPHPRNFVDQWRWWGSHVANNRLCWKSGRSLLQNGDQWSANMHGSRLYRSKSAVQLVQVRIYGRVCQSRRRVFHYIAVGA